MNETPIKEWSEIRVDGASVLNSDHWIKWGRPCWEISFPGVVGRGPYRIRTPIPATMAATWHVALPVGSVVFLEARDLLGLVVWSEEKLTTAWPSSGATSQMPEDPQGQAESAPDVAPKAVLGAHRKWMEWARDLLTESNPSDSTLIEDMLANELRSALTKLYALQREALGAHRRHHEVD